MVEGNKKFKLQIEIRLLCFGGDGVVDVEIPEVLLLKSVLQASEYSKLESSTCLASVFVLKWTRIVTVLTKNEVGDTSELF